MGRKKVTTDKEVVKKKPAGSIIDYISWLTYNKRPWEDLSELEKKNFQPFILNKFLSMDPYYCEAINELQEYTIGMDKDKVWRVYYELLPKDKIYINYIKDKSQKEYTVNELDAVKKNFNESEQNCIEYLSFLKSTEGGNAELKNILKNFSNG